MLEIAERTPSVESYGAFCAGVNTMARWFALYTTPRHEKHVSEMLAQRQIETFLPLYRTTRRWKKSRPVVLDLPLFPTYVFVRIAREARATVVSVPGVLSIVGSGREPWPLPDPEIEAIRLGLQMHKIEPHPYLTVGERVRIKAGVMAGVEGVLVRKKNDLRVVLSLDAIMRSVAVEVDADDIEPANAPAVRIAC
ncbi:MAG: UpxY family transcription antiterminator [Terracidiphilus sp.]